MLTAEETVRINRIRAEALRGGGAAVSREDKQWTLDIAAREGTRQDPRTLLAAMREGYDVSGVFVKIPIEQL